MDDTKRCTACGQTKLTSEFYRAGKDRPGKYQSRCKPCHTASSRKRLKEKYVPHPHPPLPSEKPCGRCKSVLPLESFPPRSDGARGVRSICYDCKRAEKREYNERNAEKRRKDSRRYYAENTEKIKAGIKRTREKNPDKYRAIHAAWKRENKPAVNASTHRRRARLKRNGGSWTAADWERLKAQYGWRCARCGLQEVTDGVMLCFDHVVPLAMGGLNLISNGQPLCRRCNSTKHTKAIRYNAA